MKELYSQKWYTPGEVARLRLIQNRQGDKSTFAGNYAYIMRLINSGTIKARDYSRGPIRSNWLIPESEIARYHQTVNKMGGTKWTIKN